MSEELITVEDAARIFKVRRETIRRYIKNGHLPAITLPGGDYRIRAEDVQKLINGSVQGGSK
jgi:excisionase family DNA binding protein